MNSAPVASFFITFSRKRYYYVLCENLLIFSWNKICMFEGGSSVMPSHSLTERKYTFNPLQKYIYIS